MLEHPADGVFGSKGGFVGFAQLGLFMLDALALEHKGDGASKQRSDEGAEQRDPDIAHEASV